MNLAALHRAVEKEAMEYIETTTGHEPVIEGSRVHDGRTGVSPFQFATRILVPDPALASGTRTYIVTTTEA